MKLKFAFSEGKAVEALAYVASVCPGLSPIYVSKVFFFAEKWHLNAYGRPIIADTYIAMPMGPVPSSIKNFIDANWERTDKPEGYDSAIRIDKQDGLRRLVAGERGPDQARLSDSDRECLLEAIDFCKDKTPDELSAITHLEKAWRNADANRPMDYADFIDDSNPHRAEILAEAEEIATYGIL